MSDELELNLDLEPEEKEEDEEDKDSSERRIPTRVSTTSIQYWVDTGNAPCKMSLDDEKLSETGSSSSEEEVSSLLHSSLQSEIDDNRQHKSSSCSSINTAAYILSNAYVTKKEDTIAIIEGAKNDNIKSPKYIKDSDVYTKDTEVVCNNRNIQYIDSTTVRNCTHNDNNYISTNVLSTVSSSTLLRNEQLRIDDNVQNNAISANIVQPNMSSHSSRDDKTNEIGASQKNVNIQGIKEIASIFQQFDKTSKRLSQGRNKNDENKLERHSIDKDRTSENIVKQSTAKDTNLTLVNRKKLYTGRNSPVDLMLIKKHSINRVSTNKLYLHPALDSDDATINKNKTSLASNKKTILRKKRKRKGSSSTNITYVSCVTNVDKTQVVTSSEGSYKSLSNSERKNLHKRSNGNGVRKNISVKAKTCRSLTSLNLNPVILLEKIKFVKQDEPKCAKINDMQKNNLHIETQLNMSKTQCKCLIDNLDSESIGSNSTIIIYKSHNSENFSYLSNCVVESSPNVKRSFSLGNREEKDNLLKTNNINMILSKKPYVLIKRLTDSEIEYYSNATKLQIPNGNDKLAEDSQNTKQYNNKKSRIISEDPVRRDIQIETCVQATYKSNSDYSSETHTKSKKNNTTGNVLKCRDTSFEEDSLSTSRYKNHVSQVDLDKFNGCSVLSCISSDEEFTQLIQPPKKRLKVSRDKKTPDEINGKQMRKDLHAEKLISTTKHHYNSYSSDKITVICSSKKVQQTETNKSLGEKQKQSEFEVKSFGSNTSSASIKINKKTKLSFFQDKSDNSSCSNSSAGGDPTERERKNSFINRRESPTKNNNKRYSDTMMKKKEKQKVAKKNDNYIRLFQTRIMDSSDSSHSEGSDIYVLSNCEPLRISSGICTRSQHRKNVDREKFLNTSVTKRYVQKPNSFVKKRNVTNRIGSMGTNRSRSIINEEIEISERFNKNINLDTDNTTKNVRLSVMNNNNAPDNRAQKENNIFLNTSLGKSYPSRSPENKQPLEKVNKFNKLLNVHKHNVKSTMRRKLLTFQTKNNYGSDTSESL